jgi:hypothetical protein
MCDCPAGYQQLYGEIIIIFIGRVDWFAGRALDGKVTLIMPCFSFFPPLQQGCECQVYIEEYYSSMPEVLYYTRKRITVFGKCV